MRVITSAVGFLILSIVPAHAYLDPGTGSMLVQGLIGALAIGGAAVSAYWNKIRWAVRSFLGRENNGKNGGK
ncbi:hypothetical protein [Sinorhizobium meliloti]|uniref:hypothetical protein n=1 Tax=Rhizobium meliloti TaxID=382 RepID=UPI000B4A5204|nr:hypothetical protein [Sinorhizobium meliloti]ASP87199.1 hypothetical protein CDO26_22440 [Sinorhizobium meliloti]MQW30698.1 hypothetical protein [Sinorhizobium meliloti]MQX40643.1 hypothetical protein [Sinorhizobium meliloti]MQX61394.1 hypothetical protein [Sinorhizobium meliloti]MQX93533.1 hypothetical protein [Sinorhizobium meliloti]